MCQLWLATPRIRYVIRKRSVFILFVRVLYVIDICICHGGKTEGRSIPLFHFLCFCFDFCLRLLHVIKAHAQLQRVISLRIYCNRLTEHCVNLCVKFSFFRLLLLLLLLL